jgi:hypothetical protein
MTHARRVLRGLGLGLIWSVAAGPGMVRPVRAQAPVTRAERTDWVETSRYADVLAFLEALEGSPVLHRTGFGYSLEGRPLPLVVAGRGLASGSPADVLAAGRTRVLLFANIHAGEVEGKEALQILLRRLAAGEGSDLLDSLVLLVAPIYNADGNERVSVLNRTRQNGPLGGVGQRENAQGLDLNRDHMKLESPEARSLVGVMAAYDPHVIVDLHTTNGTRHGYHLTYSPPLHPDTDPAILSLLRDRWLPEITRAVREEHGFHTYYYGNAYAPEDGDRGWYTFDYRPRFNNNYVGLRNRVAILSEAYSYAAFEDRVAATLAFVEAILERVRVDADRVAELTREADARDLRGRRLGLRATFERGDEVEILMGAAEPRRSRYSGQEYLARLDEVRSERMREYGSFRVVEEERVPAAYYVPAELEAVTDLLAWHGIRSTPLDAPRRVAAERFVIDSTRVADQEFQGHREREVFGSWTPVEVDLDAGTLEVPLDQPLARLVFHLLEPRAADGVVNWNLVDEALAGGAYPVLRRPAAP